jgi:2-polyprenyl-6-methoxyphenol hydroxylase-like FAD-dependent oxidoreductase
MPPTNILILGGGICGVASAIAISNAFSTSSSSSSSPLSVPTSNLNITIFELRKEPSTIGGAVNLTPNAVRGLDILGVLDELKTRRAGCEVSSIQLFSLHTGSSLGTIDYAGPDGTGHGGYRGRRVMRSELLQALLAVAQKLENVRVVYGKKVAGLTETSEAVTVAFEDGTDATGDLVLGCDGIHSTTRMRFIEPDRVPTYSGVASAYGFANVSDVLDSGSGADDGMFFTDTALAMSRRGALLMTYCDDARQRIYVGALMETAQQVSKEGWRALGDDREVVKQDVVRRFEVSALPHMKELVHGADEWFFYPIYRLSPQGKWCTDRVMLLGDAAHAVRTPPPKSLHDTNV